jgi:hypothetical protein
MLYTYDASQMKTVPATNAYLKGVAVLLIACLMTFGLTAMYKSRQMNSIEYITEETRTLILNQENQFSESALKKYIADLNIRFPRIVFAQAKLESGHFKSDIFRENHNLFGMKVARRRPTTNKGENRGHAYFDSWKESVLDYAFYQSAYLFDIKTESQYLEYLKLNYADDPGYYAKLLDLLKK